MRVSLPVFCYDFIDSKHRLKSQIVEIAKVSHELEEKVCVCVCVEVWRWGGRWGVERGESYSISRATTVNA